MKKDCDLNFLILESRTDFKEQFLTVRKEFWQILLSLNFVSIEPKSSLETNISKKGYLHGYKRF